MTAKKRKEGRLHLRIEESLLKKAKKLADKNGITLTMLVESCLRLSVAEDEQAQIPIDAEQI